MKKKKRIILKISGASLKSNENIYCNEQINNLVVQIKNLVSKYSVSIVLGGGNIFRGNLCEQYDIKQANADYIAMLATVMNCIMLENVLNNNGIKSKTFSSLKMDQVCDEFTLRDVNESLENDIVCLFAGGTGSPFFSTDTGAALRASQIGAEFILMGKNGVDGIYDSDPSKNKKAIFFNELTYDEIIERNLKVMDLTAITLCKENKIKLLVFNANEKDAFLNALENKTKNTIVK